MVIVTPGCVHEEPWFADVTCRCRRCCCGAGRSYGGEGGGWEDHARVGEGWCGGRGSVGECCVAGREG